VEALQVEHVEVGVGALADHATIRDPEDAGGIGGEAAEPVLQAELTPGAQPMGQEGRGQGGGQYRGGVGGAGGAPRHAREVAEGVGVGSRAGGGWLRSGTLNRARPRLSRVRRTNVAAGVSPARAASAPRLSSCVYA